MTPNDIKLQESLNCGLVLANQRFGALGEKSVASNYRITHRIKKVGKWSPAFKQALVGSVENSNDFRTACWCSGVVKVQPGKYVVPKERMFCDTIDGTAPAETYARINNIA